MHLAVIDLTLTNSEKNSSNLTSLWTCGNNLSEVQAKPNGYRSCRRTTVLTQVPQEMCTTAPTLHLSCYLCYNCLGAELSVDAEI